MHLHNSNISEFHSSLYQLPSIEIIDLRFNPLKYIDLSNGLWNLRQLYLDYCNLTELKLFNATLSNIEVLTVSGNSITDIDFRDVLMPRLRIFEAKNTAIKSFNFKNCNLSILTQMTLDGSPITSFELGPGVPGLKYLNLRATKLTSLYLDNSSVPALRSISLDNSSISRLYLASRVQKVTLKHTKLTVFDTRKLDIPMLTFLDISSSLIKEIDLSKGMDHLNDLFAKSTKLFNFNSSKYPLPSLTNLVLSKSLKQLKKRIVTSILSIK